MIGTLDSTRQAIRRVFAQNDIGFKYRLTGVGAVSATVVCKTQAGVQLDSEAISGTDKAFGSFALLGATSARDLEFTLSALSGTSACVDIIRTKIAADKSFASLRTTDDVTGVGLASDITWSSDNQCIYFGKITRTSATLTYLPPGSTYRLEAHCHFTNFSDATGALLFEWTDDAGNALNPSQSQTGNGRSGICTPLNSAGWAATAYPVASAVFTPMIGTNVKLNVTSITGSSPTATLQDIVTRGEIWEL